MHTLIQKIKEFSLKNNLIHPNDTIIIGLSGGPDSVFLAHVLHELRPLLNLQLIAAHLDHEWRSTSAQDEAFCAQLAQKLELQYISARASSITLLKKQPRSKEAHGRALRRTFFENLAVQHNAQSIALGHHADDQQETFFIRLLRGATITGLASMRPRKGLYIRPLLNTYKRDILSYLNQHTITFREDPTNTDMTFLRNRIRYQLLPILPTIDNRFEGNFIKTIQSLQSTELFLEKITDEALRSISMERDQTVLLNIQNFLSCDAFLQPRILIAWLCKSQVPFTANEGLFKEIIIFLQNNNSPIHTFYNSWYIEKKQGFARIYKQIPIQ